MINVEWAASFLALILFVSFSSLLQDSSNTTSLASHKLLNIHANLHKESETLQHIRNDLKRIYSEESNFMCFIWIF